MGRNCYGLKCPVTREKALWSITGVCSYVQKHVIDALEGFSQFLANEVSKVRNIVFVIVFIFGFINCNVVLLDANTANFSSTSLALTALIFTLSTYIGIVIVNSVLCRKKLKFTLTFSRCLKTEIPLPEMILEMKTTPQLGVD